MKEKRLGIALIICAPSGTGKTTLVKTLVEKYPHFSFSISCTTRSPRQGEIDGKDYHFITKEEFLSRKDAGFFAEWAEVHGNYYGTPLSETVKLLENGNDVLFDIDVQGARQLRLALPKACFIFILPPSYQELEKRLRERKTENEESLKKRLAAAKNELSEAHWFDFLIVNQDLTQSAKELEAVYLSASLAAHRNMAFLENMLRNWQ